METNRINSIIAKISATTFDNEVLSNIVDTKLKEIIQLDDIIKSTFRFVTKPVRNIVVP
jgi:hypothetical protein